MNHETIFAPATAPGRAGVAIVRISGPQACEAYTALTGRPLPPPRLATRVNLYMPDQGSRKQSSHRLSANHQLSLIDHALTLFFPAPHSFTGEDLVEFHLHGGRAIMQEMTEALLSLPGLRIAEPGEFSKRAFLNGKMDLLEAEAIADLVDAETALQKRQALRQMEGELSRLYEDFRTRMVKNLAHLEATIDFPDEDIPDSVANEIQQGIAALHEAIAAHLNDGHRGEKIREGLHIAILGAPNSGKSSLLNLLAKRNVAIVSSTAGTTRDVIEVHLELGGLPVTLADTAGIRKSTDAIENEGVRRALERASTADIKLVLLDATTPYPADILALIDKDTLVAVNKSDTANPAVLPDNIPMLAISATLAIHIEELLEQLSAMIAARYAAGSSLTLTRARHRQALELALAHLDAFLLGKPLELACEELRQAANAIGKITGRIEVDALLDIIFKSFCIGK